MPLKTACSILVTIVLIGVARAAPPTSAPVAVEMDRKELKPGEQANVVVTVDVPPGLHAQSHTPSKPEFIKFQVTMAPNPAVTFGEPFYPKGVKKTYPALGELDVYEGQVKVQVPLTVKADAPSGPAKIEGKLQYQMCDDQSCYMPQRPPIAVETTIVGGGAGGSGAALRSAPASAEKNEWTIWTAFGAALLAGLAFNIMPCVLPVLPLKAAAFHRAAEHHRSRSIMLGVAFSIGIIAVFAILAVLVLVLRVVSWGSLFSNAYFVWFLVILLVACALGMFGAFTLTLPNSLYAVDPQKDTFGGNVIFGAFTAILATPCTAPLLPGLLIWASSKPALIGVPAMLMVGVGMALPYLILSAFPEAAKKFPRTGPWSELFKQMMGFLLLIAATYFAAGRLIHGPGFWWAIVAVTAVAALYLVARTVQLTPHARPVGISAAIAVAMLGGTIWWTATITGLTAPAGAAVADDAWKSFSDDQFKAVRDAGKPVLVKFTANWCGTCQYIEGTVFRDAAVWKALKERDVVAMKVDFSDSNDVPGKALLLALNPAGGIPLTAIYSRGAKEPVVLASVYSTNELLDVLKKIPPAPAASVSAR